MTTDPIVRLSPRVDRGLEWADPSVFWQEVDRESHHYYGKRNSPNHKQQSGFHTYTPRILSSLPHPTIIAPYLHRSSDGHSIFKIADECVDYQAFESSDVMAGHELAASCLRFLVSPLSC